MSWLPDPEKIVRNLISSLGVSPEDFVAFITMARDEFAAIRADRLAFRPASIRVVNDMTARMDRIEAGIKEIRELLEFTHGRVMCIQQTVNDVEKEMEHERDEPHGTA